MVETADSATAGPAPAPVRPAPITLTDAAVARARVLLDKATRPVLGLRIGVKQAGCSGLRYQLDYVDEAGAFEDVVEVDGVKLFIDPTAVMFLLGTEMDYEDTKMHSGFVFRNPNATSQCGCGESFSV